MSFDQSTLSNTHVKQDSVHVYSLALILRRAPSHSIRSLELFRFLVVLQNFDEEHSLIIMGVTLQRSNQYFNLGRFLLPYGGSQNSSYAEPALV